MTGTVVELDLNKLLTKHGGDYVAAYEQLVAEETSKAVERAPRSTSLTRTEAWKRAVANRDKTTLDKMRSVMRRFVTKVMHNADVTSSDVPLILDEKQAEAIAEEVLDLKKIQEFLKARYDELRATAFNHLTETFAEEGEEFPEHVNGSIDVPALGISLSREGCGRKDPEVDEDKLRRLLGKDLWAEVTTEVVVPAQLHRELDLEKLFSVARQHPVVLEQLRSALKVGEWKGPRFTVRELKQKE